MKIKYCIRSMRLRTLPLSLAGVIMGVFLSASYGSIDWIAVLLLILTTISLQVLCNLSNELGDALHGTDTDERQGMKYSLMDGYLTVSDMKKLISGAVAVSSVFGVLMIWRSFGSLLTPAALIFVCLGAIAIWAAMHYTLGNNPYGYRGLGDISVLIFFGFATVIGGFYLCAHSMYWNVLLPALSIGFFSVGVLNVNNLRDMKTDIATRTTVAIKLGARRTRIYQTILIVLGWLCMTAYCIVRPITPWQYLYFLTLPLFCFHLRGVWRFSDSELDPMLPLLVISSFLFSILAGVGIMM
ncbi:MAG: 1,4-dihydroxy-2-naphthoate octaprenyltransferase [Bacteroidaceae bacterium]|nr:1,4-dihydroxy-2-naphthoate octaprenyltransferase [Bacteroidaceae bacterium]